MGKFMFNMNGKAKIALLQGTMLVLLVVIAFKVPGVYKQWKYGKEPVKSISSEFVGTVRPTETIGRSMLRVTAETPSGEKYDITDRYSIDVVEAPRNGSSFEVTVSYRGVTDKVIIPVTRNAVVEYSIGYPYQDSVKATVYSNGDLVFDGEGETQKLDDDNIPWAEETYSYVEFLSDVEPRNIDYWFSDNPELTICRNIPNTVESMLGTFKGDTGLLRTPEYFQCTYLRVMQSAFEGCSSLDWADTLPINVQNANYIFSGCSSLKRAPDIMKAGKLEDANGMFKGCTKLADAPQLPNSVITMKECYKDCINIHKASTFPVRIVDITSSYENCTSLETAAPIPESVISLNRCFAGCRDLNGYLEINTDSREFSSMFYGAVESGKELRLSGNCGNLISIQHETGNRYIILDDTDEAARQAARLRAEMGE